MGRRKKRKRKMNKRILQGERRGNGNIVGVECGEKRGVERGVVVVMVKREGKRVSEGGNEWRGEKTSQREWKLKIKDENKANLRKRVDGMETGVERRHEKQKTNRIAD